MGKEEEENAPHQNDGRVKSPQHVRGMWQFDNVRMWQTTVTLSNEIILRRERSKAVDPDKKSVLPVKDIVNFTNAVEFSE